MSVDTVPVPSPSSTPRTGFGYLDAVLDQPGSVLAMAHRGGGRHPDLLGLENTAVAFRHAVRLGYRYLETDVHVSRDGVLHAFHDDSLDRVTDAAGVVGELTAADIASARIDGREPVPLMADLLEEFPGIRFNIDLKSDGAVRPLADLIDRHQAAERICVGSFSLRRLDDFRRLTRGRVVTSAAPMEVAAVKAAPSAAVIRRIARHRFAALQVPHRRGRLVVVNGGLVRRAHAAGLQVHVWTVDEATEMNHLLDLGVDGVITDRTDVLRDVLEARGQWRDRP